MTGTTTRRMIRALVLTVLGFATIQLALFCAPDPARWRYNWAANPGGLAFLTALLFVVYGVPAWGSLFALLTAGERRQERRRAAARKGDDGLPWS